MTKLDIISTMNYKLDRMDKNQARKQLTQVLSSSNSVLFSRHALDELEKDDLTTLDAINILKSPDAKILSEGELVNGTYRYRVETAYILIVIAFTEEGLSVIVVTAWDKRKGQV